MKLFAKILLAWGFAILGLLYLAYGIAIAVHAYLTAGALGLVLAIILLTVIPSLAIGALLSK